MKTTAPQLPTTRRSRFAPLDSMLLTLFRKYPSRSGRNINFRKAFQAEPGLDLNGEKTPALRSYADDLISKHLRDANGGSGKSARKASRFAAHDQLLRELFTKYPTESGKCVSFKDAFKADPSLKAALGIKTIQDMHSCEQHARKLFGHSVKQKRRKPKKLEVALIPPPAAAVAEPPPTANYCWNCGAPHREVNQALALLARLRR